MQMFKLLKILLTGYILVRTTPGEQDDVNLTRTKTASQSRQTNPKSSKFNFHLWASAACGFSTFSLGSRNCFLVKMKLSTRDQNLEATAESRWRLVEDTVSGVTAHFCTLGCGASPS